jgi:glycosyltransferase involved in cell wall biosynthesis
MPDWFNKIENIKMNFASPFKPARPTVFVFPTFLAVGGVERNTVEVMSRLQDEYDFVVVTFERLTMGHGSLHHQFLEHSVGIYDLAEIGSHDEIASYLSILNMRYQPALVWICNGCPWLAAQTSLVRQIFSSAAIIDQQVYDTQEGWVSLYRERNQGILSYDRHIAINSKIRDLFSKDVGIPDQKIDLIYPAISSEKREIALAQDIESLRLKFGLPRGPRYFASIGRLAMQKQPLALIDLIREVVEMGYDDIHFLLIGSGDLDADVDDRIKTYGLESRVRRFTYVQNVFEIVRLLDAVIFTSLFEGLPIALLEALSLGVPGLCTKVGDIDIVFNQYSNGTLFDAIGDIGVYSQNFRHFIENYDIVKAAAENSSVEIASRFSMDNIAQQYRQCFASAMTGNSQS